MSRHLNEDVIEAILSQRSPYIPFDSPVFDWKSISGMHSDTHDKTRMTPLCLISRSWLVPARRILYRTIFGRYDNELIWKTIVNFPRVRHYIRRMYLPHGIINSRFGDLGWMLPNCTIYIGTPIFDEDDIQDLVETDAIGYLKVERNLPLAIWTSGSRSWTRLQVLSFDGSATTDGFFDLLVDQGMSFLPALRSLKFRRTKGPLPISKTLHTLVVADCDDIEITSLCNLVLRHSASLERICFQYISTSGPVKGGLMAPDSVFDCLPPSLVDLTFSASFTQESHDQCEALVKARSCGRFPRLCLVAMDMRTTIFRADPPEAKWKALCRTGMKAGVSLKLWEPRPSPVWAKG